MLARQTSLTFLSPFITTQSDKRQFVVDRVIPYYFGVKKQYEELIYQYSNIIFKMPIAQFLTLEQQNRGAKCLNLKEYRNRKEFIESDSQIRSLKKERDILVKPYKELYKIEYGDNVEPFFYQNKYVVIRPKYHSPERELAEQKLTERRLRENADIIQKLKLQIKENEEALNVINEKLSSREKEIEVVLQNEYDSFVDEILRHLEQDKNGFWWFLFNNQNGLQTIHDQPIKEKYVEYLRSYPIEWIKCKSLPSRFYSISTIESYDSKRFDSIIQTRRDSINRRSAANQWKLYIKEIVKKHEEEERKRRAEEERKRREAEEKRLEQYRFNMRNKHWRDDNISFRKADHVYIVDGTPLDSVTTFVKNCFPEFNSEFHAKRKAETLGITKEEVLKMWDKKGRESREQGTAMHEKIESYYLGKSVSADTTFELFKIFANKITLKPYRTEWAVYDWEQKIAGTIDFVDYQNGEYIIYDWKRSDKLIAKNGLPIKNSQYGEKALPPIENLDDSPYYHYALQLSLYKYILEKNYGITVSKLRLGIFHPSYNKPYVLEMPYLRNEIDTLFGYRSEVIF